MALVILNNVGQPYGQFDGYDAGSLTLLGGEVARLVGIGINSTDKKAKDVDDGYVNNLLSPFQRPVVQTDWSAPAAASTDGFFFLTDDGTANYGTLFGTVVGGIGGQVVSGGAQLGPHTATGSGKVTLWSNPGMYGVTLDAMDTAANGVVPTNGFLAVGTSLSYTSAGKLTMLTGGNTISQGKAVARFVEFSAGDTLVTTPRSLSRVGIAGGMLQFRYAVINFNPPSA